MAQEYSKVLLDQQIPFKVVGRSSSRVDAFKELFPDVACFAGGLDAYKPENPTPEYAIVATNVSTLVDITKSLIAWGVKNILVEKPLAFTPDQVAEIQQQAHDRDSNVYIAYRAAAEQIKEDGGLTSVHFEFTEWVNRIDTQKFDEATLNNWVIANSSHVIDLVFHLAGKPKDLSCWVSGDEVKWHPSGSIFMGAGYTELDIPFNYYSNWRAPGRWSIQFSTRKHRLHFAPMEQLALQKLDSVQIEGAAIDYGLDEQYKPGVYAMVSDFLRPQPSADLCTLSHLHEMLKVYRKMANYQ